MLLIILQWENIILIKIHGKGQYRYASGKTDMVEYFNGKIHGPFIEYKMNNNVKFGHYDKGKEIISKMDID